VTPRPDLLARPPRRRRGAHAPPPPPPLPRHSPTHQLNHPQIERVDDTTFRCYVGQLAFLGFSVEPVITVSVTVEPRGCTIRLLSCRLQGSKLVEEVNNKFTAQVRRAGEGEWEVMEERRLFGASQPGPSSPCAGSAAASATAGAPSPPRPPSTPNPPSPARARQMTNAVTWAPTDDPGAKAITSDTTIEVDVEVPGWFLLPTASVEAAGSGVMAATLKAMVPRFLKQLEKDYALWASGDDSRKPIGDGVL
jgi:hypothetical protein